MSRHVYLSFLLPLLVLPSTNSVYFRAPLFNGTSMNYQGDAVPFGSYIEFNLVNYINRVGWATYPERVRLWDSTSGQLSDFTSHFSFTIDTTFGAPNHGHGLSFFLAPVRFQIPPNSAGGFLGLYNTTTMQSSLNQIVSVEFDSFSNDGWDPSVEHVGINYNNISSAVYTPWNASFHSGDTAEAWITYNSTGRNLSVFWNYQTTSDPRENSSLFYIIDLSKFLPEWVTVGFSAATGSNIERHRLLSWEFNSSLSVGEKRGKKSKKTVIIVGVNVPVFILIAGSITAYVILWRRKQRMARKRAAEKMTSINEDLERGAGPRRFSYDDLVSATNNFSDQRKLGEGGFGAVYRGYLNDMNMEVAVKKISGRSRQGKKEYITEKLAITDDDDMGQAECLMIVGIWCAHPDHNMRPSVRQAIQVLNFEAAIPDLPRKMPVPVFHVPLTSSSSSEPGSITNTSLEAGGR
ncbi:hypothetical protein OIU79_000059 [Salix purpurea]|uniref:Legume lectin domain-containing protein n=1 Tax=Salix purpurea TaxID=77065 RepID=A0A9Q0V0E0_SALPP|nr:hypothetical protein OIU79_000059 [Salix purpurea]